MWKNGGKLSAGARCLKILIRYYYYYCNMISLKLCLNLLLMMLFMWVIIGRSIMQSFIIMIFVLNQPDSLTQMCVV